MQVLKIEDCAGALTRLGRTFDGPDGEIWINWTCAGLRFNFTGSCLTARLGALYGEEMEFGGFGPMRGEPKKRRTWPCAAVFIDDGDEPVRVFEVNDMVSDYLLFSSDKTESHVITLRKLTENPKGKLSVNAFLTDGAIEKAVDEPGRRKLEFIGDSITCGFGNMTKDRDRMFYSADENGWEAHPGIAARKLGADLSVISFSGIAITNGIGTFPPMQPSMSTLYPYTDKLIEEARGKKDGFQVWDFEENRPDVIVLNLGTNDASVIDFNGDIPRGIVKFEEDYYDFLKMLRIYNGPEPWIVCTLGSMDYFLYNSIEKTASRFAEENADPKITCYKYGRMRFMDGFGACGHPNWITHQKMGNEIADFIAKLPVD